MILKFTEHEIQWLGESIEALQIVIDYHDVQITMGEPMGYDCSYHIERIVELRKRILELKKIEEDQ